MSTKKVGSTGRFGSRYGVGVRKRVLGVEKIQKQKHRCPYCQLGTVKRLDSGIFKCRKCGVSFTGGAYFPKTMTGSIVQKMVEQRYFAPAQLKELLETTEKAKHHAIEFVETEAEAEPEEKKTRKARKKIEPDLED